MTQRPFPESPFPLLPLRSGVLLPEGGLTLTVGRPRSLALIEGLKSGSLFGVVTQRDPKVEEPVPADFHAVGTIARLSQIVRVPGSDALRITVEGLGRFAVDRVTSYEPFLQVEGAQLADERGADKEAKVLAEELESALREQGPRSSQIEDALRFVDRPGAFADRVAGLLGLETSAALEVLVTLDVQERVRKVLGFVFEQRELSELRQKIGEDVRREIGKNQREHLLREQLRAIRRELGDDKADEASKLRDKLDKAGLSDEAREVVERELSRLEGTGGQGAEATVIKTYLEWIAALPWSARAPVNEDIDRIAHKLDADHTGLDDVKKRILEHMAVLKLSGERGARSSASWARRAWARPPSASPSPTRRAGPSCASRSAACATRPRFAGTAAPTSARCRGA
jgi:ATP-dependent Lon protease